MLPDIFTRHRQSVHIGFFLLGIVLTVVASGVLVAHTKLFGQKRDTAVMIGTELPELKSSVALLAANVEAQQLFSEQAMAAREEQASVYILPETTSTLRAVSAMQETALALGKNGGIAIQSLRFDAKALEHGSTKELKGTLVLRGSFQDVSRFLGVLGYAGDMMIRDVISLEAQDAFLRQVEASSPLSLGSAEDFLYMDLMQYAADPDTYEERMIADVPADVLANMRATVLEAGLIHVRQVFQGIAAEMRENDAWPLPLLIVKGLERNGDVWTVQISLFSR